MAELETGGGAPSSSTGASSSPSSPSQGKAPIGAEPVKPTGQTSDFQPSGGSPGGAPAAVRLADDMMVEVDGKVIKYGDYKKRFQSDYTKKTQALAREREQLQQKQAAWEAEQNQIRQHNEQLAAQLLARQQGGNSEPGGEFIAAIEAKPYITGKDMATILRAIQQEGFGGIGTALSTRDEILKGMHRAIVSLQQAVGVHSEERATQQWSTRIGQVMQELEIPDEYRDWVEDVYLAHEGDDLDEQFPEILKEKFDKLQAAQRAREARRISEVREARRFPVPGRGGNARPGSPIQLTGRESPAETAELLWERLNGQDGERT